MLIFTLISSKSELLGAASVAGNSEVTKCVSVICHLIISSLIFGIILVYSWTVSYLPSGCASYAVSAYFSEENSVVLRC